MSRLSLATTAVLLVLVPGGEGAGPPGQRKTRNVILFMSDGLRWQEVFTGADERLINKENGCENADEVRAAYWRETPEARREALMPFVWGTMARHGQIYGNMFKGSSARI